MDVSLILIIIGIIAVILSFFIGGTNSFKADDVEQISISLHEETSAIKKRLRIVEEELMIGIGPMPSPRKSISTTHSTPKPIHEIIVNQILSLHEQGYSIDDIAQRASLTTVEVEQVLRSKGVL